MHKKDYLQHLGITNYILNEDLQTKFSNYISDNIQQKIIILAPEYDIANYQNLLDKILLSFNINDDIFVSSNMDNYTDYTMQKDKVILILDNESGLAKKILKSDEDNLRNKIYAVNSNKIIVSFSLSYLANNPKEKSKAWLDFIMLKNLLV